MGGTQQREALSVQPPWLPLCDHDPEEDPAGPAGPWPEGSTEKLRPMGKPLPDPVPGSRLQRPWGTCAAGGCWPPGGG